MYSYLKKIKDGEKIILNYQITNNDFHIAVSIETGRC